jgi:16S rRNA (guanine527-N7)-methyltransferase
MRLLVSGAARLGIELDRHQIAQFQVYSRELLSWNQRFNLTAITEPEAVETRHFLDSLTLLPLLTRRSAVSVIDIGSGAGFPGLPLAIAQPSLRITLLEATQKKAAFLRHMTESLMLTGVTVLPERAEDAARDPLHREAYDAVVARALAPLPVLAELTLPFCRMGGLVAAQKKGDIRSEREEAAAAIRLLGAQLGDSVPLDLPELGEPREIVILEKVVPTPSTYPRRAGQPQKQPLGAASTRVRA